MRGKQKQAESEEAAQMLTSRGEAEENVSMLESVAIMEGESLNHQSRNDINQNNEASGNGEEGGEAVIDVKRA